MYPNQNNAQDTQESGDTQDMPGTPLESCISQVDSLIQKGGATKDELMSLKNDLENIQSDIEGEESGEGEPMPGKRPGLMIAIGLGGKKGVNQ